MHQTEEISGVKEPRLLQNLGNDKKTKHIHIDLSTTPISYGLTFQEISPALKFSRQTDGQAMRGQYTHIC
jgi:hypothetical protein